MDDNELDRLFKNVGENHVPSVTPKGTWNYFVEIKCAALDKNRRKRARQLSSILLSFLIPTLTSQFAASIPIATITIWYTNWALNNKPTIQSHKIIPRMDSSHSLQSQGSYQV